MKYFFYFSLLGIIYGSIFVYAQSDTYTDCQVVGSYSVNTEGLCIVEVRGCSDGEQTIPSATASCDAAYADPACNNCSDSCPVHCGDAQRNSCPTNPNECANDYDSDGLVRYTATAVASSAVYQGGISNCERAGETYIEDNLCHIVVTGCIQDGEPLIPENARATANCNVAYENPACNCVPSQGRSCPSIDCGSFPRNSCPTDPNECANDNDADDVGNYTETEKIGEDEAEERAEEEIGGTYHSCEQIGATELVGTQCRMTLIRCKNADGDWADGVIGGAICDRKECIRGAGPVRCTCPTDPNECANDEADDVGNYTEVQEFIQRREIDDSHRYERRFAPGRGTH